MRFTDVSFAAVCLVQLFAPGYAWPQPDQLVAGSPPIDNGIAGQPLHEYGQASLRKRQTGDQTTSTSSSSSSGTVASGSTTSSSSSSGIYTNSSSSAVSSTSMSSGNSTSSSMSSVSSTSRANSTSSTASSTSTSSTASATASTVAGVTFQIQNNTIYSGSLINLMRKRAAAQAGIDMCLNKCANSTSCAGTSYDNSTMMCSYYSSVDQSSQMTKNGTTFALVQNRASNSTNNSTTTAASSTMTMTSGIVTAPSSTMTMTSSGKFSNSSTSSQSMTKPANSTSSLASLSTTKSVNTTSSRSMTMSNSTTSTMSSSTRASNTTSSTSATPTNPVGARSCDQIAANGNTFTDGNNVTYAVICAKKAARDLFAILANLSPRADPGDVATVQSGSFEGCAPYCDSNAQCNSYSYDRSNGSYRSVCDNSIRCIDYTEFVVGHPNNTLEQLEHDTPASFIVECFSISNDVKYATASSTFDNSKLDSAFDH
ncbi:hypothetical protein JADG_009677 [Aureobasidium aubasidani]|nr:hypothetical protein JADG_009677 [Aureobasidium pullulans]